jgi:hypothetical protein
MPAISNFPNGFAYGVAIRGIPLTVANPGKVWWLSNAPTLQRGDRGGSDSNRGTFNSPFSTLSGAMTAISADGGSARGDILMVKPGHAETISSSTALTLSVAGVAIIGLGLGNKRPKFTIDTANTATINVSADNISFYNCQFFGNFLSIAACFTLTTAKWFTVQNCFFADTSGVLNFLNIVKSTGAANTVDGLTVTDSVWNSLGTTSVNSFVLTANDVDACTLARNKINMVTTVDAAILITVTAGVLTNFIADSNIGYRKNTTTANGSLINVGGTTSTGFVTWNQVQTLTTTSDKLFTTTVGLGAFENRVTGVVGASGFLIPAADS